MTIPKLLDRFSVANESIDFQGESFLRELEAAFTSVYGAAEKDISDHEGILMAQRAIKNRTGLTVTLDIGVYEPMVEIPSLDKNNILVNSFLREYVTSSDGMRMIDNADGVVKGSVNLRTGKVTGIFCDIVSPIHLPKARFKTKVESLTEKMLTPLEMAAITLHEVGHLLTYYEYISRSVSTNQVLAGLSKALDNSSSASERETVLVSVKKHLKLKDLDVQKLSTSNDKKVVEMVVVTNSVKQARHELGSNIYDYSTWEFLADQYANRHGAGRHVVTGLEKIYRCIWNISFRSTPVYLAIEALKMIMLFTPLIQFSAIAISIDQEGDGTYDTPEARFRRIRNDIVECMKRSDLPTGDKQRLIADLAVIDEVLENVNDRRQWIGAVIDLWPSLRKARNQEIFQKELEDLAVNKLFEKHIELTA